MADVKIGLVPYRGTAPVVTDSIAGHVRLGIADPPPSMGAIGEGRLKAIAVSSKQRFAMLPDVPTFDELGLKGYELTGWFGIVGAGGDAARDRDEAQRRGGRGAQGPRGGAAHPRQSAWSRCRRRPTEFAAYIDSEIDKAAKVAGRQADDAGAMHASGP